MLIDSSHYSVHKSIKITKNECNLQDILHVKVCELISQRILNQKKCHCSVLKSS